MPEDDLVLAERDGDVSERGLSKGRAIQPDLRPRESIDADIAVGRCHGHRQDLPRLDVHDASRAVAERGVDQIEFVAAG